MEKLMDKKEMAEALGVTVKTIDKWVSEKRIPFVRITGKCVRFIWSEVQGYLVMKEIQPDDLEALTNQHKPRRQKRRTK
jgi:excisionase family DNA binding protein